MTIRESRNPLTQKETVVVVTRNCGESSSEITQQLKSLIASGLCFDGEWAFYYIYYIIFLTLDRYDPEEA